MIEKGLPPVPKQKIEAWEKWLPWFRLVSANVPKIQTFNKPLTPTSVAANSTSEQTFTITGLTTNDIIAINKPSHTTGIGIANVRVSAVDTLAVTFINTTGGGITPPSEYYKFTATRL